MSQVVILCIIKIKAKFTCCELGFEFSALALFQVSWILGWTF